MLRIHYTSMRVGWRKGFRRVVARLALPSAIRTFSAIGPNRVYIAKRYNAVGPDSGGRRSCPSQVCDKVAHSFLMYFSTRTRFTGRYKEI